MKICETGFKTGFGSTAAFGLPGRTVRSCMLHGLCYAVVERCLPVRAVRSCAAYVGETWTGRPSFWSTLEQLGHEEQGKTCCMDSAQPHTLRLKKEAVLKCMRTRSSRKIEDLVELDFTTGRKKSRRTHRVQADSEVVVTETMDVPEGNGNPLDNGLGRARQTRPIGLGDAPNRHQQRQGIVPPPVQNHKF
ncbi:unnamed protein product [Microthlaspi erraticum]|uniref:Uncharacterized protein n=1 Tax=Microthlaspi erraticum TaxID=1685480 RepID=A0A6D2KCR5_9BRAS|nr:unnamed protein product [Microthlaspi erraticum]